MSKLKATPGPWRLGKDHCIVADSEDGITIRGALIPDYYGGNMIAESVSPANAHLIAAAPELYALLDEFPGFTATLQEKAAWASRVISVKHKARGA